MIIRMLDIGRMWRVLTVTVAALTSVNAIPAHAQTFSEEDFLRQSKFCEVATRLPAGDADQHRWGDCLQRQGQLRSQAQRETDYGQPKTQWMRQLTRSRLWLIDDACEQWAKSQPENPPGFGGPRIWWGNHAWNICMRREGIFSPINAPADKQTNLGQ